MLLFGQKFSAWRFISAISLLLITVLGVIAYSYEPILLGFGIGLYAAAIFWRPYIWLLLFPPIIGWLNLAPWSGSFFLEEFDLFVLVTVSILLVRNAYGLDRVDVSKWAWVGLGLFSLSWAISLAKGLLPMPAIDANAFSSYYSRYNALRVGKAFLWGAMLLPAVSHAYRNSRIEAARFFSWGMAIAVFGVGIISLWERGVFTQILYAHNVYAIFNSILDFTTQYRITGLFAGMHTGGESIDCFLAMTLPFALYAAFHGSNKATWLAGAMTAIFGFYAAAVTFSRTTYLATIVLVATLGIISFVNSHRTVRKFPVLPFLGIVAALILLAFEYQKGGSLLLFSGLMACAGAAIAGFVYQRFRWGVFSRRVIWVGWVLFGLFAVYGSARGMLTSKWVQTGQFDAIFMATVTGIATAVSGAWLGARFSRKISIKSMLVITVLFIGVGATIIPALFGYRMEERFSESAKDLTTRVDHWKKSFSIMDDTISTHLFGQGMGRFPNVYFWKDPVDEVGVYRFVKEDENQFLTLRAGPDLRYGQRIDLAANNKYILSFDARTHDKDLNLRIRICRRNIIEPFDWNPECIVYNPEVRNKEGDWHHYTWIFNIGGLGDGARLGRKPLMLELANWRVYQYLTMPPTLVDIDNLSIKDSSGSEYLRNGNFEHGAQAWYPYFDFSHLPWHTKNFWIGLYFDQGILGILGLAALLIAALQNGIRRLREHDLFAPYLISSLAGFLAVGMFGTLVDVPRIMVLFYIILFALTMLPRAPDFPSIRVSKHISSNN